MRIASLLTLAVLASAAALPAATINFVQSGWDSGGTLSVAFTAEDLNADTFIVQSELTAFNATWETPLGLSTSWGLPNIEPDGFFFTDLDNFLLFTRNPAFSLVNTAFEGEVLASVFDGFLFPVDSTAATPTAVPEPGTLGTIGLLAIGVGLINRRRSLMPSRARQ